MRLDNEILWIKHFRKPEIGRNLGMPITFLTRQNFLRIFKHIVPKRRFRLGTICLKILRIFCGSRGRKICFRPVISSRSYLAIFIPNEISSICFVTSFSRRRLLNRKIGQQSNLYVLYISIICWASWRSRNIANGRNIYLESSILYNYFVIASCLLIT